MHLLENLYGRKVYLTALYRQKVVLHYWAALTPPFFGHLRHTKTSLWPAIDDDVDDDIEDAIFGGANVNESQANDF